MNINQKHIELILSSIPEKPGCYQYFDKKGIIIYVGKAKNLKKRVLSYFQKESDNNRIRVLIAKICDVKYIVVDTEEEALLLENNLIKQYRPRYNVLLKDDKTYPFIVIRNEPFPRIFQTRNFLKDGSLYFGPYASVYTAKVMLQMIKSLYPVRSCKYPLSALNIKKGKYKVCLNYHIKRCKAPCIGLQNETEYNRNVSEIKDILKGNSSRVINAIMKEIKQLVSEMRFEEAQVLKEKYNLIENYRSHSTVVTPELNNIDVFSYTSNEQSAYINYMHIGSGAIVQVYTIEYKIRLNEIKEEILALGIIEMRERFKSTACEIIVPFLPDVGFVSNVLFTIPSRGDKKKLLDLSVMNVKQFRADKLKQSDKLNPEQRITRVLKAIQSDLHLNVLPLHIECFDNSNIQGTNPVAACVVFKNAKPSKKDYRHFHIKTVVGPDDFASMEEVVTRRYTRMTNEGTSLPQLIIIDGGKGQLNVATSVLQKLNLTDKITVVGLAKRLEEIFFPGDPVPLVLDKTSETLKIFQQLRDEAHRFGITFHRNLRSKQQIRSELDEIKGVGEKTKEVLLKKYKSMKRLRNVPEKELAELIGEKKAKILIKYINDPITEV